MFIKVYHSFCSDNKIVINGHVLRDEPVVFNAKDSWLGANIKSLYGLFKIKPIDNITLKVHLFDKVYTTKTREDGYFRLGIEPPEQIKQGWHIFEVSSVNENNERLSAEGKFFKPPITSHGIISDIDDTILKSYSNSLFRRLYELFTKNPETRKLFDNTVDWYRALSKCSALGKEKHPIFYVSSSEWNLYDYLNTVFKKHKLPKGIFLLNDIKTIHSFFKTGKTGHRGKYDRIRSLLESFPDQKYILIGDNTQRDPYIYMDIINDFPGRIIAVFIRNKEKRNKEITNKIIQRMKVKNDQIYLFDKTVDAIQVSKEWGLINSLNIDI